MAKSKKKPFKQYKVPREKFLVVVDAWGLIGDFLQSDFNQISAWFEIMLEDAYPKTRVSSIYYQRTHRNIIVELPREVEDTNQYLGAHFYSQFLTHDTAGHRQVLIYEYNYATFGDPGEKNWSVGYPNYTSIPPEIPIKRPFPLLPFPSPLPASDIPYARPVPVDVLAANQKRHIQALKAAEPTLPCSSSTSDLGANFSSSKLRNDQPSSDFSAPLLPRTSESPQPSRSHISNHRESPHSEDKGKSRMVEVHPPPTGGFTPYVAPSHLTSHLKESIPLKFPSAALGDQITKRDPYEEDEESRNILRSPVKTDEAEDFLGSFLPTVKKEEETCIKPEDDDDYRPSAELLAALNTLPPELLDSGMEVGEEELKPQVKPEPIEPEIGDYHPSDELLAALAELPSGLRPEQVAKSEVDEYQPSHELLAALSSLPPENFRASTQDVPVKREQDVSDGFDERNFTPRVKQEPMEGVLPRTLHRSGQSSAARQPSNSKVLSAPQSHIQVKSEPMDDGYRLKYLPPPPNHFLPRQVDYDASRDPRLKRPDLQSRNSGDKRDGAHLSHLHANTSKRIKREYLED